jgi:hypothetical protein
MKQKEKLAKRLKDIEDDVFALDIQTYSETELFGMIHKTDVDYTINYYAKLYLPNRILAKIIKEAKAKRKKLKEKVKHIVKEEMKHMIKERKHLN